MHPADNFETRYEDILDALADGEITTIIHAMNRNGSFRAGFSRQVAERFPEVIDADLLARDENGKQQKGGISVAVVGGDKENPLRIISLYCIRNNRDENGSLLSVKQLKTTLHLVNAVLDYGAYDDIVGFPRIGAGIAGGDWDEVAEVIDDTLDVIPVLFLPESELHESIEAGQPKGRVTVTMSTGEHVYLDVTNPGLQPVGLPGFGKSQSNSPESPVEPEVVRVPAVGNLRAKVISTPAVGNIRARYLRVPMSD